MSQLKSILKNQYVWQACLLNYELRTEFLNHTCYAGPNTKACQLCYTVKIMELHNLEITSQLQPEEHKSLLQLVQQITRFDW